MKYLKTFESLYDFENPDLRHIEHSEEIKSIFRDFAEDNNLEFYDWTDEEVGLENCILYTFLSYTELKKKIDEGVKPNIGKRLINKMFENEYMTIIIQLEKQKELDSINFFKFDKILKDKFIKRMESIGYKIDVNISKILSIGVSSANSYQINLNINYSGL
jgi:hypothetical protein